MSCAFQRFHVHLYFRDIQIIGDKRLIIGTILLRITAVLLLIRLLHGEVCSSLTLTEIQNSKLKMRLRDQMVWEQGMLIEEVLLYSYYI